MGHPYFLMSMAFLVTVGRGSRHLFSCRIDQWRAWSSGPPLPQQTARTHELLQAFIEKFATRRTRISYFVAQQRARARRRRQW